MYSKECLSQTLKLLKLNVHHSFIAGNKKSLSVRKGISMKIDLNILSGVLKHLQH
jgi:hypothetical protein